MLEEINVNSWEEFESRLEKLRVESKPASGAETELWFRGQENSCWPLTSTLERSTKGDVLFKDYYQLIHRVKAQIESFTGKDWKIPPYPEVANGVKSYDYLSLHLGGWPGYEYLAYLRHHDFPSPLLDWSRSSRVAAYFAFRNAAADHVRQASIFVFSEEPFTSRTNTAPNIFRLGPHLRTHRRHFLQRSDYTLCLSFENGEWRFARYDDVFRRSDHHQGVYRKINIPSSERMKVLRLLDEYNLNELSLFESEEALMKTLAFRELAKVLAV
jgi:hypothetical protein